MKNFEELMEEKLQDLYSAETQLIQAMPQMSEAAESAELQAAFDNHFLETQNHIKRLEKIGEKMNLKVNGKECKGMKGLIEEAMELVTKEDKSVFRDAALIAVAQSIEHYEIAGYGSAMAYAKLLGANQVLQILKETLEEEKDSDRGLTDLAESQINPEAKSEDTLPADGTSYTHANI